MSYVIPNPYASQNWPLPNDYHVLGPEAKKEARLALLQSWWDPEHPDILLTNPYNFEVAFKFFVDTYCRKAKCMRRVFARPDCRWAPYWRKLVTHPSAAAVGFRGSSKTVHFCHLLPEFVALCRPGTPIAVSEFNDNRTRDEVGTVQKQLEENELLCAEFGEIKPKKSGSERWSSAQLDLSNGSQIRGVSIKAGHRGRHPLLFINDDVEKDEESEKEEWREYYMETFFFKVVTGMMRPGSHIVWAGTFLNPVAVLVTVVRKQRKEFQFWKTISCPLIVRRVKCTNCTYSKISDIDADLDEYCPECGTHLEYPVGPPKAETYFGPGAISMWPEYYSVADAILMLEGKGTEDQRIRAMGPTAFWTEMMNRPELGGDRLFDRSDQKHGFRIFVPAGKEPVVEIMAAGERRERADWLANLRLTAGVDPADSQSKQADYAAIVVLGHDPHGYSYLLDAWQGRPGYAGLIQEALNICELWKVDVLAWEKNGLGRIITQQVATMLRDWREEGKRVPIFVPIEHSAGMRKPHRIKASLEVPMIQGRLLFPVFREIDGVQPMLHRNTIFINMLLQQFDRYTSKGSGTGHDDLIDAYEMAFFANQGYRPILQQPKSHTEKVLDELEKAGIRVTRAMLPMELWTREMWLEARGLSEPKKKKRVRPAIWK